MSASFRKNLTGKIFERLTVLKFIPDKTTQTRWECQCSCGNTTIVTTSQLNSGKTKSCGCFRVEDMEKRMAKKSYLNKDEYINKKYGRLTILKLSKGKNGNTCTLCM